MKNPAWFRIDQAVFPFQDSCDSSRAPGGPAVTPILSQRPGSYAGRVSIESFALARSYARGKLGLAALRLRGSGTLSQRFSRAARDLTAVVEEDVPAGLRRTFRRVKAEVTSHRGNRERIAAELDLLASAVE